MNCGRPQEDEEDNSGISDESGDREINVDRRTVSIENTPGFVEFSQLNNKGRLNERKVEQSKNPQNPVEEQYNAHSSEEENKCYDEPTSINVKLLVGILIGVAIVAAIIFSFVLFNNRGANMVDDEATYKDIEKSKAGVGVFAEASSELEDNGTLTYGAENIIDGDLATAWVEGVKGDGVGENVSVKFDQNEDQINAICVRNGYEKTEDSFYKNNRVKEATAEFADGSKEIFTLLDHNEDQIVFFSNSHEGDSVKLTIESVYPGDEYADTCISEIELARGDWAYPSSTTMIYAEPLYDSEDSFSQVEYFLGTWKACYYVDELDDTNEKYTDIDFQLNIYDDGTVEITSEGETSNESVWQETEDGIAITDGVDDMYLFDNGDGMMRMQNVNLTIFFEKQ